MAPGPVRAIGPAEPGEPVLNRTETIQGEPEGVGDVLHRLVADGKAYAQAEVNYYKTYGKETASALTMPVILGVVALLFAHAAFLALIATLFVGLATLMSDTLAGLLTVVICLAIAGVLGYLAYSKAKAALGAGK
jgi:hypothetical protein